MSKPDRPFKVKPTWYLLNPEIDLEGDPNFTDVGILIDDEEPLFGRESDMYYALKDLDFVDIQVTYPRLASEDDLLDNI